MNKLQEFSELYASLTEDKQHLLSECYQALSSGRLQSFIQQQISAGRMTTEEASHIFGIEGGGI